MMDPEDAERYAALDKKRRDAAYQRTTIDEFDQLITFVNYVRKVTCMNGPVDALVPGNKQDATDCPLHNAVTLSASEFGVGWGVEVEETITLRRQMNASEIEALWPEAWATHTVEDGYIVLDYDDGTGYEMSIEGDEAYALEVRFSFQDDAAQEFVGRFDDDEYDFLDSKLGVDELEDMLL